MKPAAQLIFEAAEQEYEVVRLAVEAGKVPRIKLEKVAATTTQAAIDYAKFKKWII